MTERTLPKAFLDDLKWVRDKAARTALLADKASIFSVFSTAKPFSGYVKVIPAQDANKWLNLIEMVEAPAGTEFNRLDLIDAGLDHATIDKFFAEATFLEGYQKVSNKKYRPSRSAIAASSGPGYEPGR